MKSGTLGTVLHMPRHKQYQLMEDFLREVDRENELRYKIECKPKD